MVNLNKGGRTNLTKGGTYTKLQFGLGWDVNRYNGSKDFDLDVECFELGANGKCIDESHFVFYGQLADPEKAVVHNGDNRTGAGDGDDETITIDFTKMNPAAEKVIIAVTIYDGKANNQNFGMVDNAFIRGVDPVSGEELMRYDLGEDFSTQLSVVFGEVYKNGGDWKFRAVGEGYEKELADLCHEYGINT